MRQMSNKGGRKGYTLVELVAVLAILAILVLLIAPHVNRFTQAAKRTASEAEAVEVADAAKRYLSDQQAAGEKIGRAAYKLINQELDNPDNVLRDYISGGMEGARIEHVYVDIDAGILRQLTYVNQFDRVRISYDSEGRQKVEHVDSGI